MSEPAMQTSVIISPEFFDDLGLQKVLEACRCRSPQGTQLKNRLQFFSNDSRDALQEELDAIGRLILLVRANNPQITEAQTTLSRLRELKGTLTRLDKDSLLNDTEFFELKSALSIFDRLGNMKSLLDAAGISFGDTKSAAALLDPAGTGNPAFHIYNDYSPELSEIRAQKNELESKIRQATGPQRKTLLTQRALITAREDREEENVRRQLGEKLAEWLPEIRNNTHNCATLDFRLAKAILAVRWNGCQPQLVEQHKPAILQDAFHPLVAAILEKQGASFTPISIELRQGATVLMGANMGGKSVALKTTFLALLMTQLGYFPSCESLQTPLFDFFAFEASREGDLNRGLSSFGLEAVQIRNQFRKSKTQKGLILMDEPCRGTNPAEATTIVQALCNTYGNSDSTFFIATHYHVKTAPGIRFYQVRGINPDGLAELPNYRSAASKTDEAEVNSATDLSSMTMNFYNDDLARVRRIQSLMDYRLEEIDGVNQSPSGAIKIAELLGVDEELLREMKAARQED